MTGLLTPDQMFFVKRTQGINNDPGKKSYYRQTGNIPRQLILAISFLFLIVSSCSRDRLIQTPDEYLQLKKVAGSNPPVIEVYPGNNDSRALTEAFNQAKASGKGSIVKLMPGEFKIGMIEVLEFFGTLTGSGKDKTVIYNLPGLTPDADTTLNKLPALITFIGGDVSVSDLTLKTSEDSIPWLDNVEMNMILFSDYAADFIPVEKHITVNIDNISLISSIRHTNTIYLVNADSGYKWSAIRSLGDFNGIKVAPDLLHMTKPDVKRTQADVNISNSFISGFCWGVYIWGCQNGLLNFGVQGGNRFESNASGLRLNNNCGLKVKVENNTFKVPDYFGNCLDINTGEAEMNLGIDFEDIHTELGTYEVRNNAFYVGHRSVGIGMMDAWRCAHPDNPLWINLVIQNNTFHSTGYRNFMIVSVNMKNVLIMNNTMLGDYIRGGMEIQGMYYLGNHTDDINYFSEGMRIINNKYMQDDFLFDIKWDVKDCMLGGDLSNVFIADQGIGTRFVGLYKDGNPSAISKDVLDKMWKRYYGKK